MKNISIGHAVVMGGARGIGEAVADLFLQHYEQVTILDRDPQLVAQWVEKGKAAEKKVAGFVVDITDEKQLTEAIAALKGQPNFKGIQTAVNTVGIFQDRRPLLETDAAAFRHLLEVNLLGAHFFSQAINPLLTHEAALIHLGSINGDRAGRHLGAYRVSKAGLHMLARCLALELARDPRKIRVNVVAPGWVDTPGEREVMKGDILDREETAQWIPLKRRQTAEEIAAAIHFLASPEGRSITGQVLFVDGGVTA